MGLGGGGVEGYTAVSVVSMFLRGKPFTVHTKASWHV